LAIKLTYDSDDEKKGEADHNKILETGDFFGEVSIIYDCKRSSTVCGDSYGTYGEL